MEPGLDRRGARALSLDRAPSQAVRERASEAASAPRANAARRRSRCQVRPSRPVESPARAPFVGRHRAQEERGRPGVRARAHPREKKGDLAWLERAYAPRGDGERARLLEGRRSVARLGRLSRALASPLIQRFQQQRALAPLSYLPRETQDLPR